MVCVSLRTKAYVPEFFLRRSESTSLTKNWGTIIKDTRCCMLTAPRTVYILSMCWRGFFWWWAALQKCQWTKTLLAPHDCCSSSLLMRVCRKPPGHDKQGSLSWVLYTLEVQYIFFLWYMTSIPGGFEEYLGGSTPTCSAGNWEGAPRELGVSLGLMKAMSRLKRRAKSEFESSLFGENTFWARCKVSFQFLCSLQCHELLLYYLFVLTAFQRVESFYSSFPKFKTKGRNSIKNHFSIFLKVCTLYEHFAKVSVVSTLSMVSLPRIRSHRCSQALKQSLRTLEPKIPRFGVHGSCHH